MSGTQAGGAPAAAVTPVAEGSSLLVALVPLVEHRWLLIFGPLLAGCVAFAASYALTPVFTSRVSFLPAQQQQGAAAAALASLGSLASLAGGASGLRTPGDQYMALMQSSTMSARIIDRFALNAAYKADLRIDAEEALRKRVRIEVGKRDGVIVLEVDDESPQRAADIANRYVDELRLATANIAVTEAQQRRVFFESLLNQTRDQLANAQRVLQASGFTAGALRTEPKAAAEGYARLKAEATAVEVRLQAMRGSLADGTPEVRQQLATLTALRAELAKLEQSEQADKPASTADYVGKYRNFKYQETLFEAYARQFELARADEARDGGLIQVIDVAKPPERKSRPRRAVIALVTVASTALLLSMGLVLRAAWRRSVADPTNADQVARLKSALGRHAA